MSEECFKLESKRSWNEVTNKRNAEKDKSDFHAGCVEKSPFLTPAVNSSLIMYSRMSYDLRSLNIKRNHVPFYFKFQSQGG